MLLQILCLAICHLPAQSVYISRMTPISRMRVPTAFRPGVNLQRHWNGNYPRLVQSASHRVPYVVYRSSPHRYVNKPYSNHNTRSVYNVGSSGPWKTTPRLPFSSSSLSTPEYEFVKAAASHQMRLQSNGGAIHTIPAPNLSLSSKPIVVLESSNNSPAPNNHASDATKSTYEVTEKFLDPISYQLGKVVEPAPMGFSKGADLNALIRNGAALQLASDLGLSAIAMPPANLIQQQPIAMQAFQGAHNPQEFLQQGLDGIIIQPTAFQQDPTLLQRLQSQLLQRFPAVEFVPYNAGPDLQQQVSTQNQIYLVANNENQMVNHQPTNQQLLSVLPLENSVVKENHKNVVRETQEGSVVTLVPQPFTTNNLTANEVEMVTASQPQNVTIQLLEAETQPATTTVKYVIETNTEEQKTTPIYYAQIGQSVGNAIASGFYSAINDVRAAQALVQVENTETTKKEEDISTTTTTTTTENPDIKTYFVQTTEKDNQNQTINELKSLLGVPFAKTDSVKLAYTLLRADDKETKLAQDGSVYAGQLVEASITEDQDFNKEKANLLARHPPLRIFTVADNKEIQQTTTTTTTPKLTVVKTKIPPRSKLTFDDKTGEPVLRIYASYVDSPLQKELIASKLANIKNVNEVVARKQDGTVENWKSGSIKNLDKDISGSNVNQVTQFGLKLRSRMDNLVPLFDDYQD